jgi:spermidine/putrescine-binding protein
MMSVFPQLQRELDKSIDSLKVPQSFGVLFFSDQTLFLDKSLMLATASNKKKAYEFVAQMAAHGTTEPKSAIQMAFAMQPQLIFVLTDGFDQGDPNEVAKQFRNLNVGKKVKINTILLRSADDPELIKVLKTIASENGGSYKEVDKQDF